jgi:hypothetical protein
MPKDYEVFEPNDEYIAQLVVRILEERGYSAGYQLGYPHNKIFIKVDHKEDADRISNIIRKFMKKFNLTDRGISTSKLDSLTSKFGSLIPEGPNTKRENPADNMEKTLENNDMNHPEKSESEVNSDIKIEEWRNKIGEQLDLLNTLISKNPNDRANNKRRIERDTLVWVLQNMP